MGKQRAINKITKEVKKKKYNEDKKNRIRELIMNKIREKKLDSILTLESKDFLFSKALPEKKIIVWENDCDVFKKMEKKIPKNVELIFGNVGKFGIIGKKVDCIYLDFCKAFETEQSEIIRLKDILKETKLFVLTFCMRLNKRLDERFKGDYQFDLLNKIQSLTEVNWKVLYGESYYDSVQMITIILENPEVEA